MSRSGSPSDPPANTQGADHPLVEPVVSRRSLVVGMAAAASAKVLQGLPGAQAAQSQAPAATPPVDPTTVQGRTVNELGARSALEQPRRKISNSGTSS